MGVELKEVWGTLMKSPQIQNDETCLFTNFSEATATIWLPEYTDEKSLWYPPAVFANQSLCCSTQTCVCCSKIVCEQGKSWIFPPTFVPGNIPSLWEMGWENLVVKRQISVFCKLELEEVSENVTVWFSIQKLDSKARGLFLIIVVVKHCQSCKKSYLHSKCIIYQI